MWKWKCGNAVEWYQEVCVMYYELFGSESREEKKKATE
jgi:hypothetical protein